MFLAEDNVSGDATFAGTNDQASIIAYVFVHVLTETKLRWMAFADDTPSAVSGEGGRPVTAEPFLTGASPLPSYINTDIICPVELR